jgi:hypothetical protein
MAMWLKSVVHQSSVFSNSNIINNNDVIVVVASDSSISYSTDVQSLLVGAVTVKVISKV